MQHHADHNARVDRVCSAQEVLFRLGCRTMIKYLGSKRLLASVLGDIATAVGARSALDLFTGTTRVAQEFKRRGIEVTAVDSATYAEVLAQCYIATDATAVDKDELAQALDELNALPGAAGYFTETFCVASRYFQPKNGARVDAMRDAIETRYTGDPLYPVLLTALMLAADRVDSTTGLQMAYLKQWAARAYNDIELRAPELLAGHGTAIRGNAMSVIDVVPHVDLAYLDPPYNQHRYFTNYHVWETLVRWDAPEHYGIACKRIDARVDETHSPFNGKRSMPEAMHSVISRTKADVVVVSYNDESWVTPEEIEQWLRDAGHVDAAILAFDSKRYVGAQIGIHNPAGEKVGSVSHLRNTEYIFVAGSVERVDAATRAVGG
jgi:adenine-specific DNA-methyltransferase